MQEQRVDGSHGAVQMHWEPHRNATSHCDPSRSCCTTYVMLAAFVQSMQLAFP
jgi:hypothetical protein